MNRLRIAACILGLAIAGLVVAAAAFPGSRAWFEDYNLGQTAWFAMYGAFAVVLLSSLASRYRGRISLALGHLLIWALLFLAAVALYAFKDDLQSAAGQVFAQLDPGAVSSSEPGEASVVRRMDGEFVIHARINGSRVQLVFDTGASTIELRSEDADRVGLPVSELVYDTPVDTANGETMAAPVVLNSVSIGGIVERDAPALVAKPGTLRESLLGRSFLDRLRSYSVEDSRLILRAR
jgi:aspartyl protease family protein